MTAGQTASRGVIPDATVLFVDDEAAVLHVLVRQLRGQPYRVLTTQSPRQALEMFGRERIDVLVSDIDMPEMSGLDLTAEVRRLHPDVVRVLLTGHASVSTAMRAINEGEVFRFLAKPWRAEELTDVLQAATKRRLDTPPVQGLVPPPARRRNRLATLEREHPGMSAVTLTRGVYEINERRLETLLGRLGNTPMTKAADPRRRTLRGLGVQP